MELICLSSSKISKDPDNLQAMGKKQSLLRSHVGMRAFADGIFVELRSIDRLLCFPMCEKYNPIYRRVGRFS